MFTKIQGALKDQKGFTLIELLVVVAIIGILVAIAIPQFASYKKNANDSAAQTDVRTVALAAEAYYAANTAYPASDTSGNLGGPAAIWTSAGVSKLSTGTTLTFTNNGGTPPTYNIVGSNSGGSGKIFTWASASGGMQ